MRKRNTKQYQDFVSLVHIVSRPEEQRFIKRYVILTTIIRALCICWLFLALCLFILNAMKEMISVRVAFPLVMLSDICVLVVWHIYRYYYSAKIVNTWAKDCDIVKYLEIYNELIVYAPARSNWGVHFYNLSMGLLEAAAVKMSEKVRLNYRLYKIALQLGDEKKAKEHKDFVIQRGGTTRYRAELMNDSTQG